MSAQDALTRPQTVTWAELERATGIQIREKTEAPAARDLPPIRAVGTLAQLKTRRCKDGERTSHLVALAGALIAVGGGFTDCIEECRRWNADNVDILPDEKIVAACKSIWAADTINHPERHPEAAPSTPLFAPSAGSIGGYLAAPPAPRRWLLKDNIVLGKVGMVVAQGGKGKSQWLLQLGVSVATGSQLAGQWEVGETGGVLMFFAEDDQEEIHRRIYALKQHYDRTGRQKELNGLEANLSVFPTVGIDTLLTRADVKGREMTRTAVVERIVAQAKRIENLKLIVIDPISRFRGGEENSNEHATRFAEALEYIAQQTGASVIASHHASKFSQSNDAGQSASRGASALTDAVRFQMNLATPTAEQAKSLGLPAGALGKFLLCSIAKTNYAAPGAPVLLERLDGGYLNAVNPTQAAASITNDQLVRVLMLVQLHAAPMSARDLEVKFGGVKGVLKIAKHDLRTVIANAIQGGHLTGGDRQKLGLTNLGAALAHCGKPSPELASAVEKFRPRKKVV